MHIALKVGADPSVAYEQSRSQTRGRSRRITMKNARPLPKVRDDFACFASPSPTLLRFIDEITSGPLGPVLDAGCGYGRNSVALAIRGMDVIGADRDVDRLQILQHRGSQYIAAQKRAGMQSGRVQTICADLTPDRWPIIDSCLSAIVCVHFPRLAHFDQFRRSLVSGGYLYVETFGGHGGNYLDLPLPGQYRESLSSHFLLLYYVEKPTGPLNKKAVTVRLFARKF